MCHQVATANSLWLQDSVLRSFGKTVLFNPNTTISQMRKGTAAKYIYLTIFNKEKSICQIKCYIFILIRIKTGKHQQS